MLRLIHRLSVLACLLVPLSACDPEPMLVGGPDAEACPVFDPPPSEFREGEFEIEWYCVDCTLSENDPPFDLLEYTTLQVVHNDAPISPGFPSFQGIDFTLVRADGDTKLNNAGVNVFAMPTPMVSTISNGWGAGDDIIVVDNGCVSGVYMYDGLGQTRHYAFREVGCPI